MRNLKAELEELTNDISTVLAVPGGREMLISMAAEELMPQGKAKKLRLYEMGDRAQFAQGGLAQYAEMTRRGGRGKDEILLHISPSEFDALKAMWGEPDINPITGLPEYGFLSDLWDGIKGVVKDIVKSPVFSFLAPLALNVFAPGLGSAIGGALGLGGKAASVVGNTLIRGGIGGLSGGKEGALAGAVSGLTTSGAGAALGSKLGLEGTAARLAGDALIGGAGAELGGGEFAQGALGQAQHSLIQPKLESAIQGAIGDIFKPGRGGIGEGQVGVGDVGGFNIPTTDEVALGDTAGVLGLSDVLGMSDPAGPRLLDGLTSDLASEPSLIDRGLDWVQEHPWLTAGAGALLMSNMGGGQPVNQGPPALPPGFDDPLPPFEFDRSVQTMAPIDYFTYGQVGSSQPGEFAFFNPNNIGRPDDELEQPLPGLRIPGFGGGRGRGRRGGGGGRPPGRGLNRYTRGGPTRGSGSGREDTIEAMLSDGEYVMDAETVALLGDGSNDEGARRLDEMRRELRMHKGRDLAKGKFSDDAKRPLQYLKKGGAVSKREVRKIAEEEVKDHVRAKPPKGHGVRKARGGTIRRKRLVKAMAKEAAMGGE